MRGSNIVGSSPTRVFDFPAFVPPQALICVDSSVTLQTHTMLRWSKGPEKWFDRRGKVYDRHCKHYTQYHTFVHIAEEMVRQTEEIVRQAEQHCTSGILLVH